MTDLGTLGGQFSQGYGINDLGEVAGSAEIASMVHRAFLYSGGVVHNLGTLGGPESQAFAVNTSGQVTGFAWIVGNMPHAFLYSGGTMVDLGTFGGTRSGGNAINDSGQVLSVLCRTASRRVRLATWLRADYDSARVGTAIGET